MGLKIDTNTGSVHSQRLAIDGAEPLRDGFRRLSTGLRITTPAEDATGPPLSERLRARVRAVEHARQQANDGIALLKTLERDLVEATNLLEHLRRLTAQDSDDNNNNEFTDIDWTDDEASLPPSTFLALSSLNIGSNGSPSLTIRQVDTAMDVLNSLRVSLDAVHQRLVETIASLWAKDPVPDEDLAMETATQTRRWIMEQASTAILGQANAQAEAAFLLLHLQGTRKPTARSRDFRS